MDSPDLHSSVPRAFSWFDIWIRAITRPTVANFEEIARDPGASLGRAYLWVAVASMICTLIFATANILYETFGFLVPEDMAVVGNILVGSLTSIILIGVAIFVVLSLLGFTIFTGVIQFAAKSMGGIGTLATTANVVSAIGFPFGIVTGIFLSATVMPVFVCVAPLLFAVATYGIVLLLIAVKAVHQLTWEKALMTVLALALVTVVLGSVGVYAFPIYTVPFPFSRQP